MVQLNSNFYIVQEDYFHLCFALGKALEDREEYEESFRFYEIGNKIKFQLEAYNADITSRQVTSIKQSCDLSMFESASTRGSRPNFHHRITQIGFHLVGTDPGQPFPGGRNQGTDGHVIYCAKIGWQEEKI